MSNSNNSKIIRFRGALYRLAVIPDLDLWKKRQQVLDLLDTIGVMKASEELIIRKKDSKGRDFVPDPFLPLNNGKEFMALVYNVSNQAQQAGHGETPDSFDALPSMLQQGIDEAVTGKLFSTLKQVRQLFDELKQTPNILYSRDFLQAPARLPSRVRVHPEGPSAGERALQLQQQQEFRDQQLQQGAELATPPREGSVRTLIKFRGSLYRLAEAIPLAMLLKDLVIGTITRKGNANIKTVVSRLQETLARFKQGLKEQDLAAAEQLAQMLVPLCQAAVMLLRKIVAEEYELRKNYKQQQGLETPQNKEELILEFARLQRLGLINDDYLKTRKYPTNVNPADLTTEQLQALLAKAQRTEQRQELKKQQRDQQLGLPANPQPRVPEVSFKRPRGRPRLTTRS
jgi:hypothetical protein